MTKADTAGKLASLFVKLLAKYPAAIEKKEDPMKEMYERIQRESQEAGEDNDGTKVTEEAEEDVPSDEHIEL